MFARVLKLPLVFFEQRDVAGTHDDAANEGVIKKIYADRFKTAPRAILMTIPKRGRTNVFGLFQYLGKYFLHLPYILRMNCVKSIRTLALLDAIATNVGDARIVEFYDSLFVKYRNNIKRVIDKQPKKILP